MIIITRNIIEILNLDKIKGTPWINEEDYGFDVLIQVSLSVIMMIQYLNIYRGSKLQLIVVFLMTIFIFYCMIVSQYGSDWLDEGVASLLFKYAMQLGLYSFLVAV